MPLILTIDYKINEMSKEWFTKDFNNFTDLLKWLREDSVIVVEDKKIDENLKVKLIISKLALPMLKIIILGNVIHSENDFFIYCDKNSLSNEIDKAIINKHKIIDNRKRLLEVINFIDGGN